MSTYKIHITSVWKIKTFLFLIVTTDITPSIKPLKKTTNLFDEFFNFLYERIPAINTNEKIENKVKTLVVSNLDNKNKENIILNHYLDGLMAEQIFTHTCKRLIKVV